MKFIFCTIIFSSPLIYFNNSYSYALLRLFENRVLRRIFGSKIEEVVAGWRRLHNEELHNLYTSPHIVRVIKSRRMRWARHAASTGMMGNANKKEETTRKT
jgi:hypothetical protein